MTKLLRILTGVHAGAELRLSAGIHRIGADDDADIRISDWRGDDVSLVVDASGVVSARRMQPVVALAEGDPDTAPKTVPDTDAHSSTRIRANEGHDGEQGARHAAQSDEEPGTVILLEFVPMQFGDTVICIGSDDAAWPSDLDLLSTLLVKPDQTRRAAERSRRRKMTGVVSACAMLGAVLVIGSVMLTTAVSRAALPRDAGDLAQRVNLELAAAHMKELHAHVRGSTVTVSGMVATADEDTQVRKMLMRISPDRIVRHYDIAQNDVRNIADSLAMQGLKVTYAGRGVFEISGKAANPRDVEAAVARMRHDLSDNVKNVRVNVAQAEDALPSAPSFSFLMASDDVRYGQTPDGVKHIYTVPEDPASSAAIAAAANGLAGSSANGAANYAASNASNNAANNAANSAPNNAANGAANLAANSAATPDTSATDSAGEGPGVHSLTPAPSDGLGLVRSGAARGVMQPVEDIPATPPSPATRAANTTAYLPLPK
ncbi:secretion protein [Burkholderia sp. WSM2232]|uniref:secretion protein n=1 Tax=Burkholderia sp. WSM2232 TaxID=944436 RepID=UPI0004817450|nr:secretion protein [Burkholderia sp. WSM2232]